MKLNKTSIVGILCLVMVICLAGMFPGYQPMASNESAGYSETGSAKENENAMYDARDSALKYQGTVTYRLARGGFYISASILFGMFLITINRENRKQPQAS